MSGSGFQSKFESEFRVLDSNFSADQGAFGTLYKVLQTKLPTTIKDVIAEETPSLDFCSKNISIIKVIPCSSVENEDRAEKEAASVLSLDHENIIKILDFWTERPSAEYKYQGAPNLNMKPTANGNGLTSLFFLRMEYADRKSLRNWIRTPSWRNRNDANKIMYGICSGLVHLHKNGIVHRDLKPENVVISTNLSGSASCVKICDFGLAFVQEAKEERRNTSRIGTHGYVSPEMMRGGGQYTEKVDIYALGVMFVELIAACSSDSEKNQLLFHSFLLHEKNYPIHPLKVHQAFPHLLTEQDALLPTLMTSLAYEMRPSAETVISHLIQLHGTVILNHIPYLDATPEELVFKGSPDNLPDLNVFYSIHRHPPKQQLLLVTRVVFRDVQINPLSIVDMIKPFLNLEHLEIVARNYKPEIPALLQIEELPFGPDRDLTHPDFYPHPKLKTYIFHQLDYHDNLKNYSFLDYFQGKNVMFFIPWPYHMDQIWVNKMNIDIKFRNDLVINISSDKRYFHIVGPAAREFTAIFSHIPFESVSINHIDFKPTLADYDSSLLERSLFRYGLEIRLEGLSVQHLKKLILKDTNVHLFCNGRCFHKLENLEELKYRGEAFLTGRGRMRKFDFSYLPKRVKRLQLESVAIILSTPDFPSSWDGNKISLNYLGLDDCHLPKKFDEVLLLMFNIQHFAMTNTCEGHQPNFKLLKSLFEMQGWNKLTLCGFDWALPSSKIQTTAENDIVGFLDSVVFPLFKKFKIVRGYSDLEFKNEITVSHSDSIEMVVSVSQIPIHINHDTIINEVFETEPDSSKVTKGLSIAMAGDMPFDPSLEGSKTLNSIFDKDLYSDEDRYFFDGDRLNQFKPPKDQQNFPTPDRILNKRVKEIVIKHATIKNIGQQLLGCTGLERLILENVRWTVTTSMKPKLSALKIFNYFEDSPEWFLTSKISLDKINVILFFRKLGHRDLWGSGIEIVISMGTKVNLLLNRELGQLNIQWVESEGADILLQELGLDTELKSLVLNRCQVSPQFIPSWLVSLNIHIVDGVLFEHVANRERFPNLKNLYYEAARNNLQELDLARVPTGLENLLIGGMKIIKVSNITCNNCSFCNCLFCPEFFTEYPEKLHVQKLLFIGGSTRMTTLDEVAPVLRKEKNVLKYVGFRFFRTDCDYDRVYDHTKKKQLKVQVDEETAAKRRTVLQCLKNMTDVWPDSDDQIDFILSRENTENDWNCLVRQGTTIQTPEGRNAFAIEEERFSIFQTVTGRSNLSS